MSVSFQLKKVLEKFFAKQDEQLNQEVAETTHACHIPQLNERLNEITFYRTEIAKVIGEFEDDPLFDFSEKSNSLMSYSDSSSSSSSSEEDDEEREKKRKR